MNRLVSQVLLVVLVLLELVAFQQLLVLLTEDIINLQKALNTKAELVVNGAGSARGGSGSLTKFLLTLFSAANVCICGLNMLGEVCCNSSKTSCGGVVFFSTVSSWWSIWKIVFSSFLALLLITKAVPVPGIGTTTFGLLLILFAVYEAAHLVTTARIIRNLKAEQTQDDIYYKPLQTEEA